MIEKLPEKIFIMPDYGPCYASDDEGYVFDISNFVTSHPNIEKIREVEDKLYGLANWIDFGEPDANVDFPWNTFNAEALLLAKEMSILLRDVEIQIFFKEHYNTPGVQTNPVDVSYSPFDSK